MEGKFESVVRKQLAKSGLDASQLIGTSLHGMLVKDDVVASKIFAPAKVPTTSNLTLSYEDIPTNQIQKGWH
jgi:hypothetical protein